MKTFPEAKKGCTRAAVFDACSLNSRCCSLGLVTAECSVRFGSSPWDVVSLGQYSQMGLVLFLTYLFFIHCSNRGL